MPKWVVISGSPHCASVHDSNKLSHEAQGQVIIVEVQWQNHYLKLPNLPLNNRYWQELLFAAWLARVLLLGL